MDTISEHTSVFHIPRVGCKSICMEQDDMAERHRNWDEALAVLVWTNLVSAKRER